MLKILVLTLSLAWVFCFLEGNFNLYSNDYNTDIIENRNDYITKNKNSFIAQYGNLPIKNINVTGLKRTNKNFIIKCTQVNKGDYLSSFNPDLFINDMNKRNIIYDINISYKKEDNQVIINIEATDKWTLIPIPAISKSSNNSSVGLILLETNFLGKNRTLGAGAVIQHNGHLFLLLYSVPKIFDTNLISSVFLLSSSNNIENQQWKGIKNNDTSNYYTMYKLKSDNIAYQLDYIVNSYFTPGILIGYNNLVVDTKYKDNYNSPQSATIVRYGLNTKLDFQTYYDYFQYGFLGNLKLTSFQYSALADKQNYEQYNLDISYSYKLASYTRIKLDAKLGLSTKTPPIITQESKGGTLGFLSLPTDMILVNNYINATLSLEKSVYRANWGIITTSVFWEHGTFNGGLKYNNINSIYKPMNRMYEYYSPGGGVQLYLKDIGVSAVGFFYAYNIQTKNGNFRFVAGLPL